jgi:glycosyltransferase involved in cell wall biosynthesis
MPHGNYEGCYPAPRSRDAIREELCLDAGRPVVSCIGWLRDYKGLDLACDAAARLGGEVQFVIAGPVHESFDARGLQQQADTLPYLKLIMRRLTDQEFVDILAASDAVLLPYRAITGSGVLLAAWTQGRGVVASDLEFFREALAGGRPAGALFEADSAPALAKAIRTYLDIGPEKRRRSALAEAAKFSWDRCVTPVADVVRGWQHAEGITPVDFAPPMESP